MVTPTHSALALQFPSEPDLKAMVQAPVDDGRTVGIVVGLLEADGRTRIVAHGSGGPDAEPLGPKSMFEIGSNTKVFTGVLLAEMVARGEVSFLDPAVNYLPDDVRMPTREGEEITLLHLATHHSGLPRMPDNMIRANPLNPHAGYTVDQLYAFLSSHELGREVGSEFEYSNLGMGLLGHLLAQAGGMSYEALLRARVLGPLGMKMTRITVGTDLQEWLTQGHDGDGNVVPAWEMTTLAGAGALRASAEDLLRFLAANVGAPRSDLERSIRTSHETREVLDARRTVGLGWRAERIGGRRVVFHAGGTAGFLTFMGFDPEKGVGAVVLTNSNPVNSVHTARLLGLQLLAPALPRTSRIEVPVEVLQSYVGEYELRPGRLVTVTVRDGNLFAQPTGARQVALAARSQDRFSVNEGVEISFISDDTGTVTGLVLHQNGRDLPASKVR